MSGFKPSIPIAVPLLVALIVLAACSTAPRGPQAGTPGFYWQAAKESFAKRDYMNAADHLGRVLTSDKELAKLAAPMRLVLNAGLANAYAELAMDYDAGAKANVFKPMPLRKVSSDYLKLAESRALAFVETYREFKTNQDAAVTLDFAYPSADMAEIQEIKKIVAGSLPDERVRAAVERKLVEKAIAMAACAAVGAPKDTAKGQAVFQAGNVQAPREVFTLAMANNLHDQARLFVRDKLNIPQRVELFADEAAGALKQVKESKETKSLSAKLDKLRKDSK
jgi:hypothetical protein